MFCFSSNLKRFGSNTSISGSQTLKTLPEIMTLQDFSDNRNTVEPVVRVKTKGLLERRGSNASLTIDLGSNSSIADIKPARLNTAKSVSNLFMSSQQSERCTCNLKTIERRRIGAETCGNCTIYESVPSKTNGCKTKCSSGGGVFHKKCRLGSRLFLFVVCVALFVSGVCAV